MQDWGEQECTDSWRCRIEGRSTLRARGEQGISPGREEGAGPYHEADGPLLIDVDGHVGALDPGVGAEVAQPHVGVPANSTMSWRVTPTGTRQHSPSPSAQPPLLIPTALPYRGTKESVFCSVVGSSSKREAMSLPCGTATSRYLIFSPVFLRLARLLPPCTVGKGSLSPARGSPAPTASGGRSRSCAGAEPRSARVQEQSTSGVDAPELRGPPCSKPHQQERKTPLNVQLSHLSRAFPPGLGSQHALGPL